MSLRRTRIRLHWPSAPAWLAWALPAVAWAPLTQPGYLQLHSGFVPIFNLADLVRHFGDLSWSPAVGQPYDLLRGEQALPYMAAAALRLIGATPEAAVEWIFGLSLLAGALGMYGWARRRLGAWPGLVAAAVYVMWPPLLSAVLVRGALAEAVLLGLAPWLLWSADAAAEGSRPAACGLIATLAAAIWTQAGLALWLAGAALLLIASACRMLARRSGPSGLPGILGWAGGVIIGGLGLLPVLLGRGMGDGSPVTFADHFVYPHQLLWPGWGRGPSIAGPDDALAFQVGLPAGVLALFGLVIRPADRTGPSLRRPTLCAMAMAVAFALLSTTAAAFFWRGLPFLARSLTYPWQLLLLAGPWLAWLAGRGARRLADLLPESRTLAVASFYAVLIVFVLLGSYSDPVSGPEHVLNPAPAPVQAPEAPLAIFGSNEIALLSAATAGTPAPGSQITVQVQWQALQSLADDYTVFVHVMSADGTRWGQRDAMPQGGNLPTSRWLPGQVVADRYQIVLPSDAPSDGQYHYLLGLYRLETGQRLPTGLDDKVVLEP